MWSARRIVVPLALTAVVLAYGGRAAHTLYSGPQAVLDSPTVDLGTVVEGSVAKHRITLRNNGARDLVIEDVVGDCACTAWVDSGRRIPPEGRGTIEVAIDTSLPVPLDQRFSRKVTITTNDADSRTTTLEIALKVKPEFALSSPILDLSSHAHEGTVDVETPDWTDAIVTTIRASQPGVAVRLVRRSDSHWTITARQSFPHVAMEVSPVVVLGTSSPLKPEIRIPVRTRR